MIEIVRHTQRNVKRRQPGDMRKRWTAAGDPTPPTDTPSAATLVTV